MCRKIFIVGITLIISIVFLSGCEEIERGLAAKKLDDEPEKFIIILEEQMNKFPHLKEAIFADGIVVTPYDEFTDVRNLLEETSNIRYLNEFYEILFVE